MKNAFRSTSTIPTSQKGLGKLGLGLEMQSLGLGFEH